MKIKITLNYEDSLVSETEHNEFPISLGTAPEGPSTILLENLSEAEGTLFEIDLVEEVTSLKSYYTGSDLSINNQPFSASSYPLQDSTLITFDKYLLSITLEKENEQRKSILPTIEMTEDTSITPLEEKANDNALEATPPETSDPWEFSDEEIDTLLPSASEMQTITADESFNLDAEIAKLDELFEYESTKGDELDDLADLIKDVDLDSLVAEAEALINASNEEETPEPLEEETFEAENTEIVFQKEDDTALEDELEFQEEEEDETEDDFSLENYQCYTEEDAETPLLQNQASTLTQKTVLTFVLLLFSASGFLATVSYFYLDRTNAFHELRAARGVSDLAMALAHAQVSQSKPRHIPATDVDFLDRQLDSVLAPQYRKLSTIDLSSDGPILSDTPYQLRLYSNIDLSSFLILATPDSSLRQFLVPKASFLVDSTTMHVRTVGNLESWASLLSSANFNEISESKLNRLISSTKAIKLEYLSGGLIQNGFTPPKELSYKLPQAEDFIYNSPRYYKFTQSLIKYLKEIQLMEAYEEKEIQTTLSDLKFHDQLLYLTKKDEWKKSNGSPRLLLGYIELSKENSLIEHIQILDEREVERKRTDQLLANETIEIIEENPFVERMLLWIIEREKTLSPLIQKVTALLQSHTLSPVENFSKKMNLLLTKLQEAENLEKERISEELQDFYDREVSYSTNSQNNDWFNQAVKDSNLDKIISASQFSAVSFKTFSSPQEIEAQIHQLNEIKNLKDLDIIVKKITDNTTNNPTLNESERLHIENLTRNEVLKIVGQLILSPTTDLSASFFEGSDRKLLNAILNNAKVSEDDERAFYLQEFDYLMEQFQLAENEQIKKKFQ